MTATIYCVVPRQLADKLHEPLREHFAERPDVEVVVERRAGERRGAGDRRSPGGTAPAVERRKIRNPGGRRVDDRRAPLAPAAVLELPRKARRHAAQLVFVERLAPAGERGEDTDTARLVTRIQAGERELFSELYLRYFERVYGYLRTALRDVHEAEDSTQQVFLNAMESLPRYERRVEPFRAWLFVIVRRHALRQLEQRGRLDVVDPGDLSERLESALDIPSTFSLSALTDQDLVIFVERLPLAQRQVLMLRYMLDLSYRDIAEVLDRSAQDVRVLNHRALRFLQARLVAIGRAPSTGGRRERSRTFLRQAPVLRSRRFALAAFSARPQGR